MLTFKSLMLGLVVGQVPVELMVMPPVASVEVRLDDRAVALLRGSPWAATIDFGDRPTPHSLVAIGRDVEYREVARTRRFVNFSTPPADAAISLERGANGRPVAAHLVWDKFDEPNPKHVTVELDGHVITVTDTGRVELPSTDPELIHVLTARFLFRHDYLATASVAFGGALSAASHTELTAVPVELAPDRPTQESLLASRWFRVAAGTAQVVGIEGGAGRIAFVLDVETAHSMRARREALRRENARGHVGSSWILTDPMRSKLWVSMLAEQADEDQFYLVLPIPSELEAERELRRIFRTTPAMRLEPTRLETVLSLLDYPATGPESQLLGNAVSAAGLRVAAEVRPRAVVLLLGGGGCQVGEVNAPDARAYLRELGVPLRVWTLSPSVPTCDWGPALDVSSQSKMSAAMASLQADLRSQSIVWIEGSHLPQTIRLAPEAHGIRLTGR